jgi:glycosyltransferase involved in cell wall biosynthesis
MVKTNRIDIAHLSFPPPFVPGSYNDLMVQEQVRVMTEFRHVVISYWEKEIPDSAKGDDHLILVNDKDLSLLQKSWLQLPERVRRTRFGGIGDRKYLVYLWQAIKKLRELKPRLIHCYDLWKMGPELRKAIDWPCRLILSEHGLSYYISGEEFRVYNLLTSFDVIWSLTYTSYRYNRSRTPKYCPQVAVLPHWINTDQYKSVSKEKRQTLRASWNLPESAQVILLLSRRVPEKGAHLILYSWPKILKKVPNAFLWIVGSGNPAYLEYIQNMINSLNISDSVRIEGYIPAERKPECYQAADLYLFPTLHSEGWALSLSEAMACGIPCISSDFAVASELYSEGELILVQDPNVEDAFVQPVVELLSDIVLCTKMGHAARKAIQERYTQSLAFAKIREFYHRQLSLVNYADWERN